ncbi:MAG: CoA ester lyase [Lachnospiraceae bacterium]|nr:CoA ester lyase [Lachnospiraceae bacterium]
MRRTMLFLPGNNAGMLGNGDVLGSDSIILDLEDAVSPDEKDSARILVRNALKYLHYKGCEIIIRINDLETPYWEKDLEAVMPFRPDVIMPTKVSGAPYIHKLAAKMTELESECGIPDGSTKIIPLLETTLGIENAFAIGTADRRMAALYLGAEDYTADLRAKRTKEGTEIFYARTRLVNAARASGIDAYDTPWTDVDDMEGLRKDTMFAKSLGYTGKAVINPRHISIVNEVFSPSAEDIAYAKDVFAAIEEGKRLGKGAVSLRGKMIDKPIVERARQVLENAKEIYGGDI